MIHCTLILPQFGHAELTRTAVRSFREHHDSAANIIVVDDGSPVAARRRLQAARLPNVTIVATPNRGVTAAWNLGADVARRMEAGRHSDHVLVFLNNDTVTTGNWLAALIAPLQEGRTLLCGPAWRIERGLPAHVRMPSRFLEGWCLAIRADVFRQLGGFDAALKLYFSDTDFQCRLIERFGDDGTRRAVSLPLTHLEHATTRDLPTRSARWRADRDRFVRKWMAKSVGVQPSGCSASHRSADAAQTG